MDRQIRADSLINKYHTMMADTQLDPDGDVAEELIRYELQIGEDWFETPHLSKFVDDLKNRKISLGGGHESVRDFLKDIDRMLRTDRDVTKTKKDEAWLLSWSRTYRTVDEAMWAFYEITDYKTIHPIEAWFYCDELIEQAITLALWRKVGILRGVKNAIEVYLPIDYGYTINAFYGDDLLPQRLSALAQIYAEREGYDEDILGLILDDINEYYYVKSEQNTSGGIARLSIEDAIMEDPQPIVQKDYDYGDVRNLELSSYRKRYKKLRKNDNGCLIWYKNLSTKGNVSIKVNNVYITSAVYFWEMSGSKPRILSEERIARTCKNAACMNVHHMCVVESTRSKPLVSVFDCYNGKTIQ